MIKPTPFVLEYVAANPESSLEDMEKLRLEHAIELKKGTVSSLKSHALIVIRELRRLGYLNEDYAKRVPESK